MKIWRINLLSGFLESYKKLIPEEQKQIDFALTWIEVERNFPTPNVTKLEGFKELYEISVPSNNLDIRVMGFVTLPDQWLYLTHCVIVEEQTNLDFEYLKADKIRDNYLSYQDK